MVNPWYKEPWPWLFMAPIAMSMIVGFSMLRISIVTSDGLVDDDYYKEGRSFNKQLDRDILAFELNANADMTLLPQAQQVRFTLTGDFDSLPVGLNVNVVHPTREGFDTQTFARHLGGGEYLAQLSEIGIGPRILEIHPTGNEWRLRSRTQWPDQIDTRFRSFDPR